MSAPTPNLWRVVALYSPTSGFRTHDVVGRFVASTLAEALRGVYDQGVVVAEEPGMARPMVAWGEIERPYHVLRWQGAWPVTDPRRPHYTEVAVLSDLDAAIMALRLLVMG